MPYFEQYPAKPVRETVRPVELAELPIERLPTGAAVLFQAAEQGPEERDKRPAALIMAGWKSTCFTSSTYQEVARRLRENGYHTLQLSLRGHQGAEGTSTSVTRAEHLEDAQAALAYLKAHPAVDAKRLSGFGTSYGAYIMACQPEDFQLLLFRAPALYPDADWDGATQALIDRPDRVSWRSQERTPAESRALAGLEHFAGDLLVIESELDEDMPPAVHESYRRAAMHCQAFQDHTLASAGHVLRGAPREEYLSLITKWSRDHYPVQSA